MDRVFIKVPSSPTGVRLAFSKEEIDDMVGFFTRAGVDQETVSKISGRMDVFMQPAECTMLSRRIRTILALRVIIWNTEPKITEKDSDPPRSRTPHLISRSINTEMRKRCSELADYLAQSALAGGCSVVCNVKSPQAELDELKDRTKT